MDRSELKVIVSVSVAELLPAASVTPAGALTLAVFDTGPVGVALALTCALPVAVPPVCRFTVVEMLPVPEAAAQLERSEERRVGKECGSRGGTVPGTEGPATSEGAPRVTANAALAEVPASDQACWSRCSVRKEEH